MVIFQDLPALGGGASKKSNGKSICFMFESVVVTARIFGKILPEYLPGKG